MIDDIPGDDSSMIDLEFSEHNDSWPLKFIELRMHSTNYDDVEQESYRLPDLDLYFSLTEEEQIISSNQDYRGLPLATDNKRGILLELSRDGFYNIRMEYRKFKYGRKDMDEFDAWVGPYVESHEWDNDVLRSYIQWKGEYPVSKDQYEGFIAEFVENEYCG